MIINGKEFEEGDRVRVLKDGLTYEGILMPSRSGNIVLKMKSGYNVGLSQEGSIVEFVEKEKAPSFRQAPHVHIKSKDLPQVSILSTGGTIASRVDYRTGAVSSQFTPDDIMDAIPELTDIANYRGEVLSMIFSEDMDAAIWQNLARAVYQHIKEGAQGVIITHGTDTLQYTAAALSFMVQSPVPDRPGRLPAVLGPAVQRQRDERDLRRDSRRLRHRRRQRGHARLDIGRLTATSTGARKSGSCTHRPARRSSR